MLDVAKIQALRTLVKEDEVAKGAYGKIKADAGVTVASLVDLTIAKRVVEQLGRKADFPY